MTATTHTPFRQLGDTDRASFVAALAGTPLAAEAAAIYDAVRPFSLLFLVHSYVEKRHDTVYRELPPWAHNPLALKPRGYPEEAGRHGRFATFRSSADCARAFRRRLADPALPYTADPAMSLRTYLTHYCGPDEVDVDTGRACDPDEYAAVGLAAIAGLPRLTPDQEGSPMAKQIVVVVPGHRGIGDDGSREEASLTPALARAYVAALRAAGHEAFYLPEHDGDTMPDNTQGGLDGVGRETLELCRARRATVMLDVHYEGTSNSAIRGCFAIVPNAAGLSTRVPNGAPADDTWEANTTDRALAAAISRRLAEATGIPRRAAREPGVMDERQTYVATQFGARLAMFAYTAPVRQTCVRLVIEHGALTNPQDRALIYQEDFTERCAGALVAAIAEVYGAVQQPPVTTPPPAPAPEFFFDGMDEQVATWLFGHVELEPNRFAPFNPHGMLSRAWLEFGRETGIWGCPPADAGRVRAFGEREYLPLRSGLVLWRANARERFRPLKAA